MTRFTRGVAQKKFGRGFFIALLGGSVGLPPRKILDFRPFEIISGAVLGQNTCSSTMGDSLPLTAAKVLYPGYTTIAHVACS